MSDALAAAGDRCRTALRSGREVLADGIDDRLSIGKIGFEVRATDDDVVLFGLVAPPTHSLELRRAWGVEHRLRIDADGFVGSGYRADSISE